MRWHPFQLSLHHETQDPMPDPEPIPGIDLSDKGQDLEAVDGVFESLDPTPSINKRSPKYVSPVNTGSGGNSGDTGGGSGGGGGGGGGDKSCTGGHCSYPVSPRTNQTLPIVFGVVIPILVAIAIFIWIHRRNRRKQRIEDANDKHGSLDFGLGEGRNRVGGKKGRKGKQHPPEMTVTDLSTEKELRKGRGMSLDIMNSPYLMAESVHDGGRRSFNDVSSKTDDPYKAVYKASSPSPSRPGTAKNDSIYTRPSFEQSRAHLLGNAQKPSRTTPPHSSTTTTPRSTSPTPLLEKPEPSHSVSRKPIGPNSSLNPFLPGETIPEQPSPTPPTPPAKDEQSSSTAYNFSLPKNVDRQSLSAGDDRSNAEARSSPPPPMPRRSSKRDSQTKPLRMSSLNAKVNDPLADSLQDYSTYADVLGIVQAEPSSKSSAGNEEGRDLPTIQEPESKPHGLGVPEVPKDYNRLSVGLRPLPPEDPHDNAEQRANRIRSFYKEYFDDSNKPARNGNGGYYEDYDEDYLGEATIWDPETGQFVVAGGGGYQRRAMTPPPRAPPRFRGPGGHHYTTSSGQTYGGSRARAFSSASGGRGRPQKRPLPPPSPLVTLPTPHLLKGDTTAFSTIDFAPPNIAKDRLAGRVDSPRMESRPYSPSVRAFTPMASPFKELSAMPSPHALRKSGTFTALDFAPPPRFKNSESGSDAGSVRSGGSGMSANTLANMRAGAYRLSRIPRETVGTKDDIAAALHPNWDLKR